MHREFTAIVQQNREDGGFSAHCLELSGAAGRGRTADEALRSLAEGLARRLRERGDPELPPPVTRARVTVH